VWVKSMMLKGGGSSQEPQWSVARKGLLAYRLAQKYPSDIQMHASESSHFHCSGELREVVLKLMGYPAEDEGS